MSCIAGTKASCPACQSRHRQIGFVFLPTTLTFTKAGSRRMEVVVEGGWGVGEGGEDGVVGGGGCHCSRTFSSFSFFLFLFLWLRLFSGILQDQSAPLVAA